MSDIPPDGWLVVDLPVSDEPNVKTTSIRKRRGYSKPGVAADIYRSRLLRVRVRHFHALACVS